MLLRRSRFLEKTQQRAGFVQAPGAHAGESDSNAGLGQIRTQGQGAIVTGGRLVPLPKMFGSRSQIGVDVGIVRESLPHRIPKLGGLRRLMKLNELAMGSDGVLGRGTGTEVRQGVGDLRLLVFFPRAERDRVVARAGRAIIDDAFAAEWNDWNKENDEPQSGVVRTERTRSPAVLTIPLALFQVPLPVIVRPDAVMCGGHINTRRGPTSRPLASTNPQIHAAPLPPPR